MLYLGFGLIGLGCAAIFPTMLHETPKRFGDQNSGVIMSLQLALAYVGTTLLPPLLGVLTQTYSMSLFPIFLFIYGIILLTATIIIEKLQKSR